MGLGSIGSAMSVRKPVYAVGVDRYIPLRLTQQQYEHYSGRFTLYWSATRRATSHTTVPPAWSSGAGAAFSVNNHDDALLPKNARDMKVRGLSSNRREANKNVRRSTKLWQGYASISCQDIHWKFSSSKLVENRLGQSS